MTAQYECYQKIMQDPIHRKEGRAYLLTRVYKGKRSAGIITVIRKPLIISILLLVAISFQAVTVFVPFFRSIILGFMKIKQDVLLPAHSITSYITQSCCLT